MTRTGRCRGCGRDLEAPGPAPAGSDWRCPACLPKTWTTGKPTQTGFYWLAWGCDDTPFVVEVAEDEDGRLETLFPGFHQRRPVADAPGGQRWCGPITPPEDLP